MASVTDGLRREKLIGDNGELWSGGLTANEAQFTVTKVRIL